MERLFYKELIDWKDNHINKSLMVVGARQIGKTYIINEFCKKEFKDYIYINLMGRLDMIDIFDSKLSFESKIEKLQAMINKEITEDTIIFFDEIQESESLISMLKLFCESSFPYKIICAGSLLGVKLKRFSSSFPVGKVIIKQMHPFTFEEFLINTESQMIVNEIRKCFETDTPMPDTMHEELLNCYRKYLCIGGMPEVVLNYIEHNKNIMSLDTILIDSIYQSYLADMKKYIFNSSESVKIEKVYKCIPSQLAKENKKFQYTKIENGARKRGYETPIEWLLASNMINAVYFSSECETPLKASIDENIFKLYLSDIGLMTRLSETPFNKIYLNDDYRYKGIIAENYVVNELVANGYSLYYWFKLQTAEIDVIIDSPEKPIPIEIKANDNTKSTSLNYYIKKFNPNISYRISSKNFGMSNNIKNIPLYAVFCLKKNWK